MAKSKPKPKTPPSARLRAQLRERIRERIDQLGVKRGMAAQAMGLTNAQLSRLCNEHDVLSLDRLADACEGLGLTVEMRAVRPYARN